MTVIYVPGTEETDPKKQNMSLQQLGAAATTLQGSVATNTASIAAHEAAWTNYTPSISSSAGSGLTATITAARYHTIGKTAFVGMDVTISAVGTASGAVFLTLPITAAATSVGFVTGLEGNVTGAGLGGAILGGATQASIRFASGASPITVGYRLIVGGTYETV